MREVPVKNATHPALVDDEDFELVAGYSWRAMAKKSGTVYAVTDVRRGAKVHKVLMHRVVVGATHGSLVDHRNRNGLDNRRENLRGASNQQNLMNRGKPRHGLTSRFKGVSWDAGRSKWFAQIGKRATGAGGSFLGRFDDETQAARAYDAAALEQFGEFAVLNFTGAN